jgi:hypothetical protein
MPVKKPANKKVTKKKAKTRFKTAVTIECDSFETYSALVNCPYCEGENEIETINTPPTTGRCIDCERTFKVNWE